MGSAVQPMSRELRVVPEASSLLPFACLWFSSVARRPTCRNKVTADHAFARAKGSNKVCETISSRNWASGVGVIMPRDPILHDGRVCFSRCCRNPWCGNLADATASRHPDHAWTFAASLTRFPAAKEGSFWLSFQQRCRRVGMRSKFLERIYKVMDCFPGLLDAAHHTADEFAE